jgi:methyltransferase
MRSPFVFPFFLSLLAYGPMIAEAVRSARHEHALRAQGAVEPSGDVFAVMLVAYPLCFAMIIAEAWLRGRTLTSAMIPGVVVFVAAKGLKYWAIATLGMRWTFRVLVPPGSARTVAGPYRWLRHPNYVAVAGELLGVALMARSWVTGIISIVGFGWLMLRRIRVEERALGSRG